MEERRGKLPEFMKEYEKQFKILHRAYDERKKNDKVGLIKAIPGNIPIIYASGVSLAEAWENALISLGANGLFIRTQYDKKDDKGEFIDPPSLDASMIMVIENPLAEPMIHKAFPGGPLDLEEYRQEVVEGVKNHWIRDKQNPEDKRWEYTYNERMFAYKVPGLKKSINQFEEMAKNLAKEPITRRAQMITWQPWEDINAYDPACLQSIWGRITRKEDSDASYVYSRDDFGKPILNINMRFRSRDAYDAAFMNDFAFMHLAEKMAKRISELRGEEVQLGRYVDSSDSFHIYGHRLAHYLKAFVGSLEKRTFEQRTITRESWKEMFEEAKPIIAKKIAEQDEKYKKQP